MRDLFHRSVVVLAAVLAMGVLGACDTGELEVYQELPPDKDPQDPKKENKTDRTCMADQGETDGPSIIGGQRLTTNGPIGKAVVHLNTKMPNENGRRGCTATLVSRDILVTAAHCVANSSGAKPAEVRVTFGNDPHSSCTPKTILAEDVIVHQDYDETNVRQGNDVAMIKLSAPAPAGAEPMAVLTRFPADFVEKGAFLAGFGKNKDMDQAERGPSPLKLAVVSPFGPDTTRGEFNTSNNPLLLFDQSQGRGSACSGDSGGPAIIREEGALRLAGVASFVFSPNSLKRTMPDGSTQNVPSCLFAVAHNSVAYYRHWFRDTYDKMAGPNSGPNPFLIEGE